MDCSLPSSSVNGIFQARILEWVAFSPPGDIPDPGIKPASPALAGGFLKPFNDERGRHLATEAHLLVLKDSNFHFVMKKKERKENCSEFV